MSRGQYSNEGEALPKLTSKTVKSATAFEYKVRIEFTDGSSLEVTGHCWEDSAIQFDVKEPQ